tara:strand:+ start:52 stop:480 length:429 start_codon:yes stop_codon:yes gene_type:complete
MSYLDTKQALITQFLATSVTGLTVNDIAYQNKFFDPANRSLWVALYFIPATSQMMGKSTIDKNEDRGIFQVSVFVSLDNPEYDNAQLTAIDQILTGFQYNSSTVYNGHQVDILDSTVNQGADSESWFQRDVSINYLTFSNRG